MCSVLTANSRSGGPPNASKTARGPACTHARSAGRQCIRLPKDQNWFSPYSRQNAVLIEAHCLASFFAGAHFVRPHFTTSLSMLFSEKDKLPCVIFFSAVLSRFQTTLLFLCINKHVVRFITGLELLSTSKKCFVSNAQVNSTARMNA